MAHYEDEFTGEGQEEPGEGFTLWDAWAILQMQRGVIVICIVLGLAASALYSASATRFYRSRSVVHISTIANQEMEMGKSVTNAHIVWNRDLYLNTLIALIQSRSFRLKVLERYAELWPNDGIGPDGAGLGRISGITSIKPRKGTELIDITVTTDDPEFSARIANLTAEALEEQRLDQNTQAASNAKAWLDDQISEYEERIQKAHSELLEFQRLNNMADAQNEQTTLDARMGQLNGALGAAHSERVQYESMVKMHEAMLKREQYDQLAKSMDSSAVAGLHSSYVTARQRLSLLQTQYGEKWHEVKTAAAELDRIEELLRIEIQRSLDAERAILGLLVEKEHDLTLAVGGEKEDLLDALSRAEDFERKRVELETAKSFFRRMKERRGELELQAKTQLNNVQIVERARPAGSPSTPDVTSNLLIGGAAGLILGLGVAFAREWLDDSISSPLDVSTYLKVPLLGTIPKIDGVTTEAERTLYSHFNPRSSVAEAVRSLRTILELDPRGHAPRALLITSAMASEGKTSVAFRMAIAFANAGRRVVLVDADLRRPRVHKTFSADRSPGLTEVLMERRPIVDTCRPTEIDNLSYLPAGSSYDRPNEALAGMRAAEVVAELQAAFDLVLIDSPPSVSISDSRILSRYVDGVVVVVKERATSRTLTRETIRSIHQVGGRVLGVVLNEMDLNRRQSYYYGYRYRYQYNYGDDRTAAK